jgi:hypothetical protein
MRLYSFTNYYLSPLQQGLQTAHVVSTLFAKYLPSDTIQAEGLYDWAENHQTIVILNGGNQADLRDLLQFFVQGDHRFPYTFFKEDEQSLNDCLTCVGIVLPEYIYNAVAEVRLGKEIIRIDANEYWLNMTIDGTAGMKLSKFDKELIEKLTTYRLA